MNQSIENIIDSYDPTLPLEQASTIPASWYTDKRVFALEQETVFSNSWHFAARLDQLTSAGDYVTTEIAGEPVVIVRGSDEQIRGFFNACRHHAAAVMTEAAGNAPQMRCPYHGWTYSLEGDLKGTPDFHEVCNSIELRMDYCRLKPRFGSNGCSPVSKNHQEMPSRSHSRSEISSINSSH